MPDPAGARSHESAHVTASEVDALLARWREGDGQALSDLIALVHDELRGLARGARRRWYPPPSLVTTDLVGEAYVKLFGGAAPEIRDRKHFFCIVARTMRHVVINRYRSAGARPGPVGVLPMGASDEPAVAPSSLFGHDLGALDGALERLGAVEPGAVELVELRFFVGLSMRDIARVTEVPERTLERRWARARAWLYRELSDADPGGAAQPRKGGDG